jgi:hypothetical protein
MRDDLNLPVLVGRRQFLIGVSGLVGGVLLPRRGLAQQADIIRLNGRFWLVTKLQVGSRKSEV